MSRRQQTTATFTVTITVLPKASLVDLGLIIRNALLSNPAVKTLAQLDGLTVTLTKRSTTYGN